MNLITQRLIPLLVALPLLLASPASASDTERYFWPQLKPGTVKVDGNLNEWGNIGVPVTIDSEHFTGGYVGGDFKGVKDCSARLRVAYDLQNLYVALSVLDDSVRPLEKKSGVPGKFWEQDGLGFYLDVPGTSVASGRYNTIPTRPWQPEPIIQLTPSTERFAAETLPPGSQWGCTLSDKGYTVEVSVPWSALGWQPQAGDRIFFSAILADTDRGPDGKDGPLHQIIWHQGRTQSRPASREFAEARLMNPGGYGGELITSAAAVAQGETVSWKLLADADQPGWKLTQVALIAPDGGAQPLPQSSGAVDPAKRLSLSGDLDTTTLKPGQYLLMANATRGADTQTTQTPLSVLDKEAAFQSRSAPLPQKAWTPDPLRSGFSSDAPQQHPTYTHEDYKAFVTKEIEAGWPSFQYHLNNKNTALGGGWWFEYGLRTAAWAVVTQNPQWIERAQKMFEMADASFKAATPPYSGLGWINAPLIYYYKKYLTAVDAWKPEYEAMAKDWVTQAFGGEFPGPKQLWLGMNNWGLSSGIRGVILKYWLGDAMPDREKWDKHIADTWSVFLNDVKDIDENTTNYAPWDLWLILFYLDVNNQTALIKTDPRLGALYERYMLEVAPSGARPHYGSTNGWHDHPALWAYLFERVGQITGDGRYKYQARMMFDYSMKHVVDWHQYHLVYDGQVTWLTRLLAEVPDDSLPPVAPEAKTYLTTRGKMYINTPEERERKNEFVHTTAEQVPGKIIFRGGNEPGSLWAMVDLTNEAGHCSARPTSVNSFMSKEAVLLSSQAYFEQDPQYHDMVWIEDLEGTQGVQPDMEITVPVLEDGKSMSYVVAQVERYMRWPVTLRRHFFFAKDRFLWVRDELTFNSTFLARIGPSWLSRQLYTSGPNWVNTYFDEMPYTGLGKGGGMHYWKNPNYDLLTWFVPRPGMTLALSDFTGQNPYMNAPLSVRQVWRGLARQGETLTFDTLLLPHAVKYQVPEANWLADTVKPLSTDPKQTAVVFDVPLQGDLTRGVHVLLVASNNGTFTGEGVTTDATQAMVVWRGKDVVNWWVRGATTLKVGDKVLMQTTQRENKEG
jgi:hypothetical protein